MNPDRGTNPSLSTLGGRKVEVALGCVLGAVGIPPMARAIGAMALSACARFPRSCLGVMTATAGLAGVGGHHPPEPGRSGRQGNTSHCGIPFGKPTRVCGNRDWQHGSPRDYGAEQRPLKAEISKVASTQINPVHLRHRVALCIAGPRNHERRGVSGRRSR